MTEILQECLINNFVMIYIDDIVIYSKTWNEHLEHLDLVFQKIREAQMKIKLKKCQFCKKQMVFLGHVVSNKGISPDPKKLQVIREVPTPKNKKQLQQYLGLLGYYQRYIQNYANIVAPLYKLTGTKTRFEWNDELQKIFEKSKELLHERLQLIYPDFTKEFIIFTDASDKGMGGILAQLDEDGNECPIYFVAKAFKGAELNYTTTEKECYAIIFSIKKFYYYLTGRKFKIVTDHKGLQWLYRNKTINRRITNWYLQLQKYDYTIEYREGRKHTNADVLSRPPFIGITEIEDEIDHVELRKAQLEDENLKPIIDWLEKKEMLEDKEKAKKIEVMATQMEMIHDCLYHVWFPQRTKKSNQTILQIVVPAKWIDKIINENHESKFSGHCGFKKTYEKIKKKYYWLNQYTSVKKWIKTCHECQMRKPGIGKFGYLQVSKVSRPMERINMDLLELPKTEDEYKYVLVIVDQFTKWIEAFPIKSKSKEEIAEIFIKNIICRFGLPEEIVSDGGGEFNNNLMIEVCRILEVKKRITTPYNPKANGAVERINRIILDYIAKYGDYAQKHWNKQIPFMVFAHNTAIHEMTEETPYFLMFGKDPITPGEFGKVRVKNKILKEEWIENLELSRKLAKEKNEAMQLKMKQQYDKNRKELKLEVGMKVWKKENFQKADYKSKNNKKIADKRKRKLANRWTGPFRIIAKIGPVTFKIKSINNPNLIMNVHADKLKPCYSWISDEEWQEMEEGNEKLIETILEFDEKENTYLVKWKNFSNKENEWIPAERVPEESRNEFHKRTGAKQSVEKGRKKETEEDERTKDFETEENSKEEKKDKRSKKGKTLAWKIKKTSKPGESDGKSQEKIEKEHPRRSKRTRNFNGKRTYDNYWKEAANRLEQAEGRSRNKHKRNFKGRSVTVKRGNPK